MADAMTTVKAYTEVELKRFNGTVLPEADQLHGIGAVEAVKSRALETTFNSDPALAFDCKVGRMMNSQLMNDEPMPKGTLLASVSPVVTVPGPHHNQDTTTCCMILLAFWRATTDWVERWYIATCTQDPFFFRFLKDEDKMRRVCEDMILFGKLMGVADVVFTNEEYKMRLALLATLCQENYRIKCRTRCGAFNLMPSQFYLNTNNQLPSVSTVNMLPTMASPICPDKGICHIHKENVALVTNVPLAGDLNLLTMAYKSLQLDDTSPSIHALTRSFPTRKTTYASKEIVVNAYNELIEGDLTEEEEAAMIDEVTERFARAPGESDTQYALRIITRLHATWNAYQKHGPVYNPLMPVKMPPIAMEHFHVAICLLQVEQNLEWKKQLASIIKTQAASVVDALQHIGDLFGMHLDLERILICGCDPVVRDTCVSILQVTKPHIEAIYGERSIEALTQLSEATAIIPFEPPPVEYVDNLLEL